MDRRHVQLTHRLCELGWLHNRIQSFISQRRKMHGLVGQVCVYFLCNFLKFMNFMRYTEIFIFIDIVLLIIIFEFLDINKKRKEN